MPMLAVTVIGVSGYPSMRERLAQDVEEAFADQFRSGVERVAFHQHDEFVAAEPTDRVAFSQYRGQPHRDSLEQSVAGAVTRACR